ncbi:hypothetical protein IEQ34_023452 [Dendrobium chrysotoxum]|uniref:Ycf2 N-terminal domain-containing protein n=1 Tax=Dendrobium chrysotoxum TaxID=161865 RepID=A0AAV7FV79_DENCH|nr:hypothetical protein IEQ34_023452 [Dendrobium chrysotoxum]
MVQWSKNFQEHFVSEQKNPFQVVQVVFDRLRINQYSMIGPRLSTKKICLITSLFLCEYRNIPIHRSEIHIYELKGPNDQLCNQLLESIGVQIKFQTFLFYDHDTSTEILDQWRNNITILFKKIPKRVIDSFHTRKNRRKSFDNTDSYLSMISHDRDNWLNPVKPFHRSSLISSFSKANRLRFLNDPHHFCSIVTKDSPLMWKRPVSRILILHMDNSSISCPFATKSFLCASRETISPIESQVSDIFIPNDFPQSGDETYNFDKLYKSFHFPIRSDPFVRGAIYSIADISATPLTEEQIVNFEKTSCKPLSDMNLSD